YIGTGSERAISIADIIFVQKRINGRFQPCLCFSIFQKNMSAKVDDRRRRYRGEQRGDSLLVQTGLSADKLQLPVGARPRSGIGIGHRARLVQRSEERRVGTECRSQSS